MSNGVLESRRERREAQRCRHAGSGMRTITLPRSFPVAEHEWAFYLLASAARASGSYADNLADSLVWCRR